MVYSADDARYEKNSFRRCGESGLLLPLLSFGLWHNFGIKDSLETQRALIIKAFDLGITHFDNANCYGPPGGMAEENFGRILKCDLLPYRDELIISTKAGHKAMRGPYGTKGSRKSILLSLDRSLKYLGLDYVDIFYHHVVDPDTPLEETMMALDHAVRSGKALYVGLSNYPPDRLRQAATILRELGTPCLINQSSYNMFNREVENGLAEVLTDQGVGCICYCPLAQGQLTNRYINGLPGDSRAIRGGFLKPEQITEEILNKVRALHLIASDRGQSLAQMALAWVLHSPFVTSALIGASKVSQIEENIKGLENLTFSVEELASISKILE